ncbi:MAG: lytic transglycosylase domain-containing protein [Chloroflexi bacterium]|nr:MAG: lytic transglycosylase domain-containing protein [Chloroflexota bacterium]TME92532.1 MAG: lytic transglycosylase domain-containing protein [Chloroflexota bacterium]
MLPLFRAVLVWTAILVVAVLPRLQAPAAAPSPTLTQAFSHQQQSILANVRAERAQQAQADQARTWSDQYNHDYDAYQAKVQAEAAAIAEASRIAALNNHPGPPAYIAKIISDAFSPLGPSAVQWAVNVAYCESRYHPNSVNSSSGASGLFQFLPSTWAFTPWHAQSPFDPVANAQAAAWLYHRSGPNQWECQG